MLRVRLLQTASAVLFKKIMVNKLTKKAISLLMIVVLMLCMLPPVILAASSDNELVVSINSDFTVSNCGSPYDVAIPITADKTIPKLYIKTIDDSDKDKLKFTNNTTQNLTSRTVLINGSTKIGPSFKKNESFYLPDSAKVTLEQLTALGIREGIDATASGYYFFTCKNTTINYAFAIVVQVRGSNVPLDYSALNAQLARIEDENGRLNTGLYYIENDCYNGKEYTTGGAWAALTKANGPYAKAKGTLTLQSEIDKAASDLSAAIDKLIPKTRANPTLLYNELNKKWEYSGSDVRELGVGGRIVISGENTTGVTWQPYNNAFNEGREILSLIYDEDGNPTTENTAELQERIEELAEILQSSVQNFVKK